MRKSFLTITLAFATSFLLSAAQAEQSISLATIYERLIEQLPSNSHLSWLCKMYCSWIVNNQKPPANFAHHAKTILRCLEVTPDITTTTKTELTNFIKALEKKASRNWKKNYWRQRRRISISLGNNCVHKTPTETTKSCTPAAHT